MIHIRQAEHTDLGVLREFEQGVINAEREFASNLREGKQQYYDLEGMLDSPSSAVMVGERDGQICVSGYARIEDNKPYFYPERYAYLGFMYVRPEYRGQALIVKLIDGLIEWSKSREISTFKLDAYVQNESAIRAYEKLGFKSEMVQMLRFDK